MLEQLPFSQAELPSKSNGKGKKSRQQRRGEKLMGTMKQQPLLASEPEQDTVGGRFLETLASYRGRTSFYRVPLAR